MSQCLKQSPHSYSFTAISVSKLLVWQMTLKIHVVLMNYDNNYFLGFQNFSGTFVLTSKHPRLLNSFNTTKGLAQGKALFCISTLECYLVIIHRHTGVTEFGLTHCSALEEEDTQKRRTHSRVTCKSVQDREKSGGWSCCEESTVRATLLLQIAVLANYQIKSLWSVLLKNESTVAWIARQT